MHQRVGDCPQLLFTTSAIALMTSRTERTHDDANETTRQGRTTMTRPRTKTIVGYHIQPMLPISIGLLGMVCEDAVFTRYSDLGDCVEADMKIGVIEHAYTLVTTIEQALEADIIERD
jgi:hypothetical protein